MFTNKLFSFKMFQKCSKCVYDADIWQRFCGLMKRCVDSNIFQRGILVAILINTLSMGIEHHNQVAYHF